MGGLVSGGLKKRGQAVSIARGQRGGRPRGRRELPTKVGIFWAYYFYRICHLFFAKKKISNILGKLFFCLGLLFLGINTMGAVMKPLAASPVFVTLIEQVSDFPVLGVLVGTLMTVVVQSSSATIAVLQILLPRPGLTASAVF